MTGSRALPMILVLLLSILAHPARQVATQGAPAAVTILSPATGFVFPQGTDLNLSARVTNDATYEMFELYISASASYAGKIQGRGTQEVSSDGIGTVINDTIPASDLLGLTVGNPYYIGARFTVMASMTIVEAPFVKVYFGSGPIQINETITIDSPTTSQAIDLAKHLFLFTVAGETVGFDTFSIRIYSDQANSSLITGTDGTIKKEGDVYKVNGSFATDAAQLRSQGKIAFNHDYYVRGEYFHNPPYPQTGYNVYSVFVQFRYVEESSGGGARSGNILNRIAENKAATWICIGIGLVVFFAAIMVFSIKRRRFMEKRGTGDSDKNMMGWDTFRDAMTGKGDRVEVKNSDGSMAYRGNQAGLEYHEKFNNLDTSDKEITVYRKR